jgi:hypothetical protein
MTNYFSFEQILKNHLVSKMTSLPVRNILCSSDIDSVVDESQINPAISITYGGDSVTPNENGEYLCSHEVNQLWNVIISVRDDGTFEQRYGLEESGDIIHEVLKLCIGERLSPDHGSMIRVQSPFQVTYENEFAHFPIAFQVSMVD